MTQVVDLKQFKDQRDRERRHLQPPNSTMLSSGLDRDDWQALVGVVAAIKQSMPDYQPLPVKFSPSLQF
jgi:hypothetical protein